MTVKITGLHGVSCDKKALLVLTSADQKVLGIRVLNDQISEFRRPIRTYTHSIELNKQRFQEHIEHPVTVTIYNDSVHKIEITKDKLSNNSQTLNYETISSFYSFVKLFSRSDKLLKATSKAVNLSFRFKRKFSNIKKRYKPKPTLGVDTSTKSLDLGCHVARGLCKVYTNRKAFIVATADDGRVLAIKSLDTKTQRSSRDYQFVYYQIDFSREVVQQYPNQVITLTLVNRNVEVLEVIDDIQNLPKLRERSEQHRIIYNLFPSLGFVGGPRNKPLEINIGKQLQELLFVINQESTYLNIRRLHIFDDKGNLLEADKDFEVKYSSSTAKPDVTKKIFSNGGFHSKHESRPFIYVIFKQPTLVSKIKLQNRSDQWGSRVKNLQIFGKSAQRLVSLYSISDPDYWLPKFEPLIREYGFEIHNLGGDPELTREKLLNAIIDGTSLHDLVEQPSKLDFLYSVLPTWSEQQSTPALHALELKLLSLVFSYEMRKNMFVSCMPFTRILKTANDLEVFENHLNDYLKSAEMKQVKLAKHGFAAKGELVENVDIVMKALLKLLNRLEQLGYEPIIAYGTLLGAHREKQFLAHDDDVDIMIKLKSQNIEPGDVKGLLFEAVSMLPKDEFRVHFDQSLHNVPHVYCLESGIMIDVFPYWIKDEKAYLHMEKMKIRGIDAEIFASRKTLPLYGSNLPAPNDIEGFLLERYGQSWNISDKYHEWPWKLSAD